mmetsp:Transcript_36370/g.91497  ORF Transcript_36370/g.91497 Transcript_36370/m.91497 type:complete len:158 (-) Transcript_36370:2033-2506(-)
MVVHMTPTCTCFLLCALLTSTKRTGAPLGWTLSSMQSSHLPLFDPSKRPADPKRRKIFLFLHHQCKSGSVGYYNLPPSLRTQLRQHLRLNGAEDELDGQLLAGFHIVHTDEFKGRVVVRGCANSKSYEEKMCITRSKWLNKLSLAHWHGTKAHMKSL